MAEEQKTCFIIMPITTPEPFVHEYRDGRDHFKHVLECLFIPSVKKAGYEPKPPIAKGSDLIHAEIIRNLEASDLLLCDMSCLNPNVFFEFGIRTSLNKPVCVVKDDLTKKVPFDAGILNHHEYASSLEPWELERQIAKIAEHLRSSGERSKGENTLWRYFGLKWEARPYESEGGAEAKLDYLALQIESMRQKIDTLEGRGARGVEHPPASYDLDRLSKEINSHLPRDVMLRKLVPMMGGRLMIDYQGDLHAFAAGRIADVVQNRFGLLVIFHPKVPGLGGVDRDEWLADDQGLRRGFGPSELQP